MELLGAANTTPPPRGDVAYSLTDLARGWDGFLDGWRMLDMLVVLSLAAGLGAAIAYHPRTRQKASTIEELEQPKTFIMYALVGAVIAIIVETLPAMALVVFGIGGLMRFRTDVGPAKDTGRVILTAVVGVCCGLKIFVVAVSATAFGWVLLWYLERETFRNLLVQGLSREAMPRAVEAYRHILNQAGCRVLGERKNVNKGNVMFMFTAPHNLDKEQFDQYFSAALPPEIRGSVDWDVTPK
jgi:hypothetical protein